MFLKIEKNVLFAVILISLRFSHNVTGYPSVGLGFRPRFDPFNSIINRHNFDFDDDHLARIVGGTDADEGVAPYQVSLRTTGYFHFCGGSIISDTWILSAAHCLILLGPTEIKAVIGSNKLNFIGLQYDIRTTVVHEFFDRILLVNDIGLLQTTKTISFNERIQPIRLPTNNTGPGEDLILTGWGTTTFPGVAPNNLQVIHLKSLSVEECREKMTMINNVYDTQICTLTRKGEGACHGDSGGPLVSKDEIVGIVSWGLPCAKGLPDVFTRVYSYLDWIKMNQNKHA